MGVEREKRVVVVVRDVRVLSFGGWFQLFIPHLGLITLTLTIFLNSLLLNPAIFTLFSWSTMQS